MRHLYGVALATATTLVMFFAGAWGYERLLRLPAPSGQPAALPAGGGSLLSDSAVLLSLAALAGTAVLVGVLVAVPRISPLAAGLPGLFLIGWTALYLARVQRATELIPLRSDAFGAGWEALLFNGILGAAGLAMIIPLFVPSRWRNRPAEPDDTAEASEASDFLAGLTDGNAPTATAPTAKTGLLGSPAAQAAPHAGRRPGPVAAAQRTGPATVFRPIGSAAPAQQTEAW